MICGLYLKKVPFSKKQETEIKQNKTKARTDYIFLCLKPPTDFVPISIKYKNLICSLQGTTKSSFCFIFFGAPPTTNPNTTVHSPTVTLASLLSTNIPSMFLPQNLDTCCILYMECSCPIYISIPHSILSVLHSNINENIPRQHNFNPCSIKHIPSYLLPGFFFIPLNTL